MAMCCTSCFSDIAIIERINSAIHVNRCGFCGARAVACIRPEELKDKLELLTYGLRESEHGITFSNLLTNTYGVIKPSVRDPANLIDQIFGEAGFSSKRYEFEFDLGSHPEKWEEFKLELKHQNRFFPKNTIYSSLFKSPTDETDSTVFFQLLEQLKIPIYRGENFFRARISDTPLTTEKMGCPPAQIVTGGRANPIGIPYLYLADNIDTCINEVRPSNSSSIYVSQFISVRDMSILDLTNPRESCSVTSFEENQLASVLTMLNLLELLSFDLSKPVRPENSHLEYIPTQFICEFIKSEAKFDGLVFNSSFKSGRNLVAFDASLFLPEAPQQFTVTSTKHEFDLAR